MTGLNSKCSVNKRHARPCSVYTLTLGLLPILSLNVSLVDLLCANSKIFLSSSILLAHSTRVVVLPAPATACTIKLGKPFLAKSNIAICSSLYFILFLKQFFKNYKKNMIFPKKTYNYSKTTYEVERII